MTAPWPTRLVFKRTAGTLTIRYDTGETVVIPYKRLRENAPSADVQGHGSGPAPPQAPVADDISVTKAEPVGRYAVRIHFSDGHSSGLFMWDYLKALGAPEAANS